MLRTLPVLTVAPHHHSATAIDDSKANADLHAFKEIFLKLHYQDMQSAQTIIENHGEDAARPLLANHKEVELRPLANLFNTTTRSWVQNNRAVITALYADKRAFADHFEYSVTGGSDSLDFFRDIVQTLRAAHATLERAMLKDAIPRDFLDQRCSKINEVIKEYQSKITAIEPVVVIDEKKSSHGSSIRAVLAPSSGAMTSNLAPRPHRTLRSQAPVGLMPIQRYAGTMYLAVPNSRGNLGRQQALAQAQAQANISLPPLPPPSA